MTRPADFDQLLNLLRAGAVSPDELARLARAWQPDRDPPFLDFVAGPVTAPAGTPEFRQTDATATFAAPDPAGVATPPATPADEPSTPGGTTADFKPGKPDFPLPPAPPGGRYVPLRHLRSGGLGSVWVTRDTAVGRDVALKTIRPDRRGGPAVEAGFVREAQLTGRLEHPCVVPVYDLPAGRPGEGPCYVMRLVGGRTLAEATAAYHAARAAGTADALALAGLLDAVVAVARAVGFAHNKGILHRDLKGQNVVLGDHGEVFLLDWGLAIDETDDAAGGAESGLSSGWAALPACPRPTPPRSAAGTPGFMSPEVVEHGGASRAADVYGLGGVLYQVLTGRPPYTGSGNDDILRQVRQTEPQPVRGLNPAVPPALAAICHRALARDPAARYATAEDFATDLRRFLADEPVGAYREPWTARAARWARRHRTGVVAAAAVLLVTAVGSAVAAALVWREKENTVAEWHRAEGEKRRAEGNFALAWDLTTNLGEAVEQIETGAGPGRSDATRRAWLDKALTASAKFLADDPDDAELQLKAARLFRFSANLSRLTGDTAGAEKAYAEALRLQAALAERFPDDPEHAVRLADTYRDRATFLRRAGKLADAAAAIDRSVGLAADLRKAHPGEPAFARAEGLARIDRAEIGSSRGRFAEAEADADAATKVFADLLAGPAAAAHPLDPLLRGMAAQQTAKARRGRAGPAAGPAELAPALAAHDEAVLLARTNAAKVPDRDHRHAHFRALAERARTALAVPDRAKEARADLDVAVAGWEKLAGEHAQVPAYREGAATAYLLRARHRVAAGDKAAAGPDLTAAQKLAEDLAEANKELPGYRALLGDLWAARAEVAAAPAELDTAVSRALVSYRTARAREPDNPAHGAAHAAVEARWPDAAARVAAKRKAKDGKP